MCKMPWTPPDAPDPFEILHSASADTREGSHADALAKFLWFHHNALQHDEALYGVRLSFALSYWLRRSEHSPPARAAFFLPRAQTKTAFAAEPRFDRFHELAAFNRELGDELRTADLFAPVARRDAAAAGRLYHLAEQFL